MVWRTRAQSGSSFGSKTTHCVPSSMDSSTKMKSRRTLMYFQDASEDTRARAPHAVAAPREKSQRVDAFAD